MIMPMPDPSCIPVSVIVPVKNEATRIAMCLKALSAFEEVVVVDSDSVDDTASIARDLGVRVERFVWDGRYPKKYQWCLDHLRLKYDRVLFVDADEIMTRELAAEIAALDWSAPGYFISSAYVIDRRVMRFGMRNKKLVLFDRTCLAFPEVDDLACPDMGEIEGHYQPRIKDGFQLDKIGQLKSCMHHMACDCWDQWNTKHERYARWEVYMDVHDLWP